MRVKNVAPLYLGTVLAVLGCGHAVAQGAGSSDKWHSVATSDSEEAFVNTASIKLVGTTVEVRVKENFTAPRESAKKGKTFLSSKTTYRLDCAARRIAMAKMAAYPGKDLQGEVVQEASRNDRNLIWMDAPRATVFGEILDYGCRKAPQAAPAQ
jgi:hypothetical protein